MLHPLYRGIAGASPGAAHFYMVTATGMVPLAAAGTSEYSSPPIYTRRFLSGYTAAGDAYPAVWCGASSAKSQVPGVYRTSKSASNFSPGSGGTMSLILGYRNGGATISVVVTLDEEL
jgi:hypothetical protein